MRLQTGEQTEEPLSDGPLAEGERRADSLDESLSTALKHAVVWYTLTSMQQAGSVYNVISELWESTVARYRSYLRIWRALIPVSVPPPRSPSEAAAIGGSVG